MRHHSIICRLGVQDTAPVTTRRGSVVTEVSFIDGHSRLSYGLGQLIDQLGRLGLCPSEVATDLGILAALITAADTRISRVTESENNWTRQIDLHLPVQNPAIWTAISATIDKTLNFLTGDHWQTFFRSRIPALPRLATQPTRLPTANPSGVCLFSGGLDSFIGAIDLVSAGETPMLISHYWDPNTSPQQIYCGEKIKSHFSAAPLHHLRARIGFSNGTVGASGSENTLRGRSFLFFAMGAMAASAIGNNIVINVPENGFISLNVPLDPLRIGALSTRTTHPFYMARFNDILAAVGIGARLENRYRHQTKGQMIANCSDLSFLRRHAASTISCSSPGSARYSGMSSRHCGHCVPCLIRRAAMMRGFRSDGTVYKLDNLTARVLNSEKAEGEHIRSFQFSIERLAGNPAISKYLIHQPGPLIDHPNDFAAYERVYVEGLAEVSNILQGVRTRPI